MNTEMSKDQKTATDFLRNVPGGLNPDALPKSATNVGTVEQLLGSDILKPNKIEKK